MSEVLGDLMPPTLARAPRICKHHKTPHMNTFVTAMRGKRLRVATPELTENYSRKFLSPACSLARDKGASVGVV
jgi:hypothetical protein